MLTHPPQQWEPCVVPMAPRSLARLVHTRSLVRNRAESNLTSGQVDWTTHIEKMGLNQADLG